MRCDKDGLSKCLENLEQAVSPGGAEEACTLEGTFVLSFGLMSKCSSGKEKETACYAEEQLVRRHGDTQLG